MRFAKYDALGNDYLVLTDAPALTPALAAALCDRHHGVGGDGVLVEAPAGPGEVAALRIFNPDGSEAEKSGNGLRIFARALWDAGRVTTGVAFALGTRGGRVRCVVHEGGGSVFIEMGRASFDSARVPVAGPAREVVDEALDVAGESLRVTAVTLGNPHCVVLTPALSAALAHRLGPALETHPHFPNRTNVQFVQVIDRHSLRIEIWERGAGYTLASGSSSCAAAAACVRLGVCDPGPLTVEMPGGMLRIGVGADFALTLEGAVRAVCHGEVAPDWQPSA